MFYIYLIQNLVNLKVYIGQSRNPQRRWETHRALAIKMQKPDYSGKKPIISCAIAKHGKENFAYHIICECETQDAANVEEIFWIQYFQSTNRELGYNITIGGNQAPRTEETKKRIGQIVSEWQKNNPDKVKAQQEKTRLTNIGKHYSPTTEFKKGNIPHNRGISEFLNDEKVKRVVELKQNGYTHKEISEIVMAPVGAIASIVQGRTWTHITGITDISRRPAKKLTDEQVMEIVGMHKTGHYTHQSLADKFGVRQGTISRILNGTRRKSLMAKILNQD